MRSVPLHVGRVELGVGSRWKIADRAVRADGVVVVLPFSKDFAGMVEGREQCLVQEFVAPATIEAFYECVLLRLAWCDVVLFDPGLL
jgi:uncharacterized membrane protein